MPDTSRPARRPRTTPRTLLDRLETARRTRDGRPRPRRARAPASTRYYRISTEEGLAGPAVKQLNGVPCRRLIEVRDGVDPYAPNAPRGRLDDLEHRAVVGRQPLAGLRNCLSERHAQARDRGAIATHRQIEMQVAVDLAHR